MITRDPVPFDSAMLDEARTYLRFDADADDPSLDSVLAASIGHAEAYTGTTLLRRIVRETLGAATQWQRLVTSPVIAITAVKALPIDGAPVDLAVDAFGVDIDASGDGWVRLVEPGAARRIEVTCQAGLAADWPSLPEAIRLGVLRLAGYLHLNRDNADDSGPPVAIAALLRPWRRMRMG
jgi:uncharacterized phiE125 gp8 family phage protein